MRLAEEARHLGETARDVRDLLYYLSDPRGFQYDYYRASEQLTNDPVLGPLAHNLAELYRHRQWEAKVQGQAMVDSATPASVAVGAGLSWDAPLCRLFGEASGQVIVLHALVGQLGAALDQRAHGAFELHRAIGRDA